MLFKLGCICRLYTVCVVLGSTFKATLRKTTAKLSDRRTATHRLKTDFADGILLFCINYVLRESIKLIDFFPAKMLEMTTLSDKLKARRW